MKSELKRKPKKLNIGILALIALIIIGILFIGYIYFVKDVNIKTVNESSLKKVPNINSPIVVPPISNSIESFKGTMSLQVNRLIDTYINMFPEVFSIDESHKVDVAGRLTPTLKSGNKVLNMDFTNVDSFSESTGGIATLFVRDGENFVRVSTSLKDANGKRAVGTLLDKRQEAYNLILQGKSYTGVVLLFGTYYQSNYTPLKDSSGKVIGIIFVGIDMTSEMSNLKENI